MEQTRPRFNGVTDDGDGRPATLHIVVSGQLLAQIETEARRRKASKSSVAREVLAARFSNQTQAA